MREKFKILKEAIKREIKEHRSTFIVYTLLRIAVIAMGILQFFNGNYENVFMCILTLLLMIIPSFVQITFKVELPSTLEIIILVFIFAAEILGEIQNYYLIFPMWDTILHTLNGFLAAAIGFSLVSILNENDKLQFELSPFFMILVAFSFSMTIGVIWEFFEFGMDQIFGMDTQKDTMIQAIHSVSLYPGGVMTNITNIQDVVIDGVALPVQGYLDIGLLDTMMDLVVNFIGASIFSVFGYFYTKYQGKIHLVTRFIPTRKTKDKDYVKQILEEKKNKQ